MIFSPHARPAFFSVAALALGCSSNPEPGAKTGARACAQAFFTAIVQHDWKSAYTLIDGPDRSRLSIEQFNRLAERYRSNLGFEPRAVQIPACDERDNEGTAHVVILGRDAARSHRYKDAVILRRHNDMWRIVLPAAFGPGLARN